MPHFLSGLDSIAEDYDHFILDVFGVIHDGIEAFPDTVASLKRLKDMGKQTCLLSNSPRRANGASGQMSDTMGIPRNLYDHIVTSGEATYQDLKTNDYGQNCWFIGTQYLQELIDGFNLKLMDSPDYADFILNSIPGTDRQSRITFIEQLKQAADKQLPMICANPDLVVNIGREQYECAGTFAKIYEEFGGSVIYHGKPHAPVYERCYELLGQPEKSKILAIGDAFHTDIAGAKAYGIDSVLNLVGIHFDEVADNDDAIDHDKLEHLVNSKPHKPNYIMNGFAF